MEERKGPFLERDSEDSPKYLEELWDEVRVLYENRRHAVTRSIEPFCADRSEAEDLAQEAFLLFYLASARGEAPEKKNAWLIGVGRNLATKRYGERKREGKSFDDYEHRHVSPGENVEETLLAIQQLEKMHEVIESLSPIDRQCLRYRAAGLQFQQIGDMLGISKESAVRRTRIAIEKTRQRLKR